jgi:hypothetical protein
LFLYPSSPTRGRLESFRGLSDDLVTLSGLSPWRLGWRRLPVIERLELRGAFIPGREGGQFLSERKKSGRSSASSLAGRPVSGSGILYVLRSRRAHRIAWR